MKFEMEITEEKVFKALTENSYIFDDFMRKHFRLDIESAVKDLIRPVLKNKIEEMVEKTLKNSPRLEELIKQQLEWSIRAKVIKAFKKAIYEEDQSIPKMGKESESLEE